jgi:hypothetical protein
MVPERKEHSVFGVEIRLLLFVFYVFFVATLPASALKLALDQATYWYYTGIINTESGCSNGGWGTWLASRNI